MRRPMAQWLIAAAACWTLSAAVAVNGKVGRSRKLAEPANGAGQRPAFMEYIGGGGAALSDVPIADSSSNATIDFFFILAFATDAHTTDGIFNGTWQPRLSPANVAAIKAAHPGVKFSASLGGGGGNPNVIFQPASVDTWIANAVSSLSVIIQSYQLDAIDIDFESFGNSTAEEFATCIGTLLTELKQKKLLTVATIAPYPGTDTFYRKLWESYNHTIDYVNYQMYSEGEMTVAAYVNEYKRAKTMYEGGRVMASFETVNNGTSIVPSTGLAGCKQLEEEGELHGIFIWSADQSYSNFQFERSAQSLLIEVASNTTSLSS